MSVYTPILLCLFTVYVLCTWVCLSVSVRAYMDLWMCPTMHLFLHFASGCTLIQCLVGTCFQTQLDLVTAVICIG